LIEENLEKVDPYFEALGRAVLILDKNLTVIHAGSSFDHLICSGASQKAPGRTLDDIIFCAEPQQLEEIKAQLLSGERTQGRRAFLNCPLKGTRLISLSAAPLNCGGQDQRYLIVILPIDDEIEMQQQADRFGGLIANSDSMKKIVHLIQALNQSDATVLITGESGVGKEVVASAIHTNSPRRNQPFIAVNCSAFPENLLENELFGHSKGAYTGAHGDKMGRLEMAGNGTLFLDEIGEIPLSLQVKLLRVLQERTYERLGDPKPRKLKARIIAATNRNLQQAIADESFREDFFYRLRVIPIHIPPLATRQSDIEVLARHLLARIGKRLGRQLFIASETMRTLLTYRWPGNVRELENAMEYAAVFCKGNFIQTDHLPPEITQHLQPKTIEERHHILPLPSTLPVKKVEEKDLILQALQTNHWNKNKAAAQLGFSRTTLWRKMKTHGLDNH